MALEMIRWEASKLCFIALLFLPHLCLSQKDTLLLKEVVVSEAALEKALPGASISEVAILNTIAYQTASVSELLNNQTDLGLRGYGPGSSVGLSIRGSSTAQVQILLNGVPFENPGLAQADLSLLPGSIMGTLEVYRGSASALLGNATIGGSLLAKPYQADNQEVIQSLRFSSFGGLASNTALSLKGKQISSATNLFYRKAANDFNRPHPFNSNRTEPQPNAFIESYGISQNLILEKNKDQFEVFILGTQTFREIPPNLSKLNSNASQLDQNGRIQLSHNRKLRKGEIESTASLDAGVLNYNDPDSDIAAKSSYKTLHLQSKYSNSGKWLDYYAMLVYRRSEALTDNYENFQFRNSPAIVAGLKAKLNDGRSSISGFLRQEALNGQLIPLIPVVSASHLLFENFNLLASGGRTYRLPGLNDLFWNPGGNPDLLPEQGWFGEFGIKFDENQNSLTYSVDAMAFYRLIDNWILWRPGLGYWSPENIKSVRSRGLEVSARINHDGERVSISHSIQATLSESMNMTGAFEGDVSEEKLLILTPLITANFSSEVIFLRKRMRALVFVNYVGERFTNVDNTSQLDPFLLADFEIHYHKKFNRNELSGFFAVRNLFNTQYQLQSSHTMPGVNFELGLAFKIQL